MQYWILEQYSSIVYHFYPIDVSAICQQAEEMFGSLKLQFAQLILLIPAGQYYR